MWWPCPATDGPDAEGGEDRCADLAEVFDLDPLDVAILVAALAPDGDARFSRLYAYLHDDVTAGRPTIGLCLELCGHSVTDAFARARFRPDAPLARHRLLHVDGQQPAFPNRTLRVPYRVVDHLLGIDLPDEAVVPLLLPPLAVESPHAGTVRTAVGNGVGLFYLRGAQRTVDHAEAAGALVRMGLPVIVVDLVRMGAAADPVETAAAVAREAGLLRAGLVAGPVDALAGRDVRAIDALAAAPGPVVLLGARGWDPGWSDQPAVALEAGAPTLWAPPTCGGRCSTTTTSGTTTSRTPRPRSGSGPTRCWGGPGGPGPRRRPGRRPRPRRHPSRRPGPERRPPGDPGPAGASDGDDRRPGAAGARCRPGGGGRPPGPDAAPCGGRMANGGVGVRGTGITALFAGPSGTGKTLAAEVIAGSLGLDLYVVDLSSVVDKYVGETEKNLEAVFRGAQGVNGVLFFDEADALFGKRSAVTDGHDRYAKIEVAYLLQRMEQFDGVSLLATNLVANLDDAFARRIDVRVVFPQPEPPERRRLWARHLPPSLPLAGDVDFLATTFRLAGGGGGGD